MNVLKEDIIKISKLAKLSLTKEELEKYVKEFNDILEYVSQIKSVDVSDVQKNQEFKFKMSDFREDIVKPSLPTNKALMNATGGRTKNQYIRVKSNLTQDSE